MNKYRKYYFLVDTFQARADISFFSTHRLFLKIVSILTKLLTANPPLHKKYKTLFPSTHYTLTPSHHSTSNPPPALHLTHSRTRLF